MNSKQICENFLNLYWLRPETVIWRSIDILKMKNIEFHKPILDLGCGDGTFSFVLHGGKANLDFDVFRSMDNTKNFFQGIDLFNHKKQIKPKIIKKPNLKIDVGIDAKNNLLSQASELKLYDKLLCHDLNKPIPLENQSFKTIFSNVFYWIKNIKQLFHESNRLLTDDGKLVICVPDIKFRENLIYNLFLSHGYKWAKSLDRGIYSNVIHALPLPKWKKLFNETGFKIEFHQNYLSEKFIQFHNIGLRPYSPYIIEMSNNLSLEKRKEIKTKLILDLSPIIQSYVDYELNLSKNNCFHLFVLTKK